MKRIFTLLIAGLMLALNVPTNAQDIFISEVADPGDVANSKFVELFNPGISAIDLTAANIYFVRQANGGSYASFQITGTIEAGQTFVVANNATDFVAQFGFEADMYNGSVISGNGDDAYMLFVGGNQADGTLYDIYGVIDEDGTGKPWEYENGRAFRKGGITSPNTTWTASEWEISSANAADCDPGAHDASVVIDNDPPVWEVDYPKAANVEDVQFDLLVQLDETSTVYYIVLDDGATAPSVAEVIAGTGSAGAAAVVAGSFTAGTSETTETVTGLTVETSYDVYVVAEDDEDTPNVQDAVSLVEITTVVMPDVLFLADFESGLDPFTQFSAEGAAEVWAQSNGYADINGYQTGELQVDYLISPEIDLTDIGQPELSFSTYWRFGTNSETHFMKLMYSIDYDGNTDNIATSTWTEIPFTIPASYSWTDIGSLDISAITGKVYFAFVYNYPDDYSNWRVDNFTVLGFAPEGTDATLSDLMVDGVTVDDFTAAKHNYTVELPAGTTTVPTVTYTTTDDNATAAVTPATDLAGDAAARTTTVEVTAQDVTTEPITYEILFNPVLEVATIAELRASADETRTYRITGEVVLTHQDGFRNKKYVQDATAAVEIDDDPGVITTSYNIGDGITGLEGKLNDYYGFWQFNPSANPGAATSNDNVVDVQVLTVSEFKTNFNDYAAELVAIEGVSFTDAGGTFANGKNYTVSVGTEATVFRSHYYDVINDIEIPKMADIQGIAIWDFSEAKIAPRVASDLIAYSSDATLSDLMVDGTSVEGFAASTLTYNITLPVGTTVVPAVTYETSDANATADVTDATDLEGDEAARTTTILVTAEDGTESTYSIVFTVQPTSVELRTAGKIAVYPVPAIDEIVITGMKGSQTIDIVNILGSKVRTVEVTSDEMRINISDLREGVYMILSEGASTRFVKR